MKLCLMQLLNTLPILALGAVIGYGCSGSQEQPSGKAQADTTDTVKPEKVKRVGMVIGLKPEKKDYYNKLHVNPWPEINDMIKKCNIRSFSIYETEIEGKLYLFGYYEYVGNDFKADMAKMAADPKTQQWWKETDPCQIRLPGTPDGQQWLEIKEVYNLK